MSPLGPKFSNFSFGVSNSYEVKEFWLPLEASKGKKNNQFGRWQEKTLKINVFKKFCKKPNYIQLLIWP